MNLEKYGNVAFLHLYDDIQSSCLCMREREDVWRGHCSLWEAASPHETCMQSTRSELQPRVSSQAHPSQGNRICSGPPFWLCANQPTRTERSISSMRTLTGRQSSNTIHDKLSPPHGSWTGSNSFSLYSFPPLFFLSPARPGSKPKGITSAQRWGGDWSVSGYDINMSWRKDSWMKTKEWHSADRGVSTWKPAAINAACVFKRAEVVHLMFGSLTCSLTDWSKSYSSRNADKLV